MEVVPFENLRVSTITMVARLEGNIDISEMMHFFIQVVPGLTVNKKRRSKSKSNVKLEKRGMPGSIYSVSGKNGTRGIICSASANHFRNVETLRIESSRKILCIKIAPSSIHITGATELADGEEAAQWAIHHITRAQQALDNRHSHPERTRKTVEWAAAQTKGELADRDGEQAHLVASSDATPPEELDADMAELLLSYTIDYVYHSDYLSKLDAFMTIDKRIYTPGMGPLRFLSATPRMANYNYSLGFRVDRIQLKLCIRGLYGFVPRYDNGYDGSVIIDLPYDADEPRKEKKVPHHTFTTHMTGSVTQCSPAWDKRVEAYNIFMRAINEIKSQIMAH